MGSGLVEFSPPKLVTGATLTVTAGSFQDIAANSDRMELLISNDDASGALYLRDTVAAAVGGTKLTAGATAVLTTGAAVRVFNNTGSTITAYYNEIRRK